MARGMVVELESERDFKKAMVLLTRQRSLTQYGTILSLNGRIGSWLLSFLAVRT